MSDVLVVGAGPVGLMAAAFLQRLGIGCDIVDPKRGAVIESRALGIHARTLEFLHFLGLDEQFIRAGRATRYMRFHRPDRELFALDFDILRDQTDYPFYLILPQSRTEAFLIEYLESRGVTPEWGVALVSLEQDAGGVDVTLRDVAGDEHTRRYRYVIGADGANSTVRRALDIPFSGATYPARFLLAEVELDHQRLASDSTHVFIGERTTVAVIPQPGRQFRIVGPDFTQADVAAENPDFAQFSNFLESNQLFEDWSFHSPSRVTSYRMHKRVAERFRYGRVFLAGDAAHIHSPAGGQGMNTGMHDAVNLAWKLALVLRHGAEPALLDSYEEERHKTANEVVASTDKAMMMFTRPHFLTRFLMFTLGPIALRFYQPVGALAAMAQLKLSYRSSVFGRSAPGALQAGDRMPRLAVGRLQTTMDAFRSGCFVLFLTGEASESSEALAAMRMLSRCLPLTCWAVSADRHFHANPSAEVAYFPDSGAMHAKLSGLNAVLCRPDGYVVATDIAHSLPNALAATQALLGASEPLAERNGREAMTPSHRTR
ncbi:pentachlorophenol 4-monooxygenase [Paraburkholderia caribensis MBA4]|uniref:Pentachlorophenol 4-monooxygenase n=1 Tax=Paraburkholderia caribensis MBA4 TaxID=1323664 RepID=A0A0P0R5F0_9BURK|nr:FAD-dependent monooxygenase [Paraburkholderia caribensis]ALL63116.1 pentachlorophenol 4-monooxygenase [Paraburkholderia caribensis MBA4]